MTRWNETCVLLERNHEIDDEGVPHQKTIRTEVYCNSYTLSTQSWATARLADYNADDEIQLRTCDYEGQPDVVYREKAYTVIHVMVQGDFTRLILKAYDHDTGDETDGLPIKPDEQEPDFEPEPEEPEEIEDGETSSL